MRNKWSKRLLAAGLAAVMSLGMLAGCGDKTGTDDKQGEVKDGSFSWWIYKTDGEGQFYETYEESPVVQYLNAQYWNVEEGGIGTEENGRKLDFSFIVPIAGSENENYNTMVATGEYPEIMDLTVSTDSPQALHENGILMDITEYVEKYMPNYMAYLDANPELKPFVQVKEDDGSVHYYAIYSFIDGMEEPFEGMCYRRDWVVKYAEPTAYVWDWESEYVKENGHPEVTPLAKAVEEDNLNGWKKNTVKAFEADYGNDPIEDYTDNVIFPSGTSDPLTISDWEWMFEAFEKAIEERGWADDSSSYCMSVYYQGFMQTGDLVSSFGGGTGQYYVKDGEVFFDGTSENFKTYLECLNTWYEEGWLDKDFNTRASDMFYKINAAGVSQGKVGLWQGQGATVGTAIRETCQNEEDVRDAYVMGAALPINDVYGGEEQMYKEPDALYQASRKSTATGITTKAEGKDLEALFTFIDWTYTMEGALVMRMGLNEEQLASIELNPDLYAEQNLTTAYTVSTDEDGRTVYTRVIDTSSTMANAVNAQRMDVGIKPRNSDEYWVDNGAPGVFQKAFDQWTKYLNTGSALDYAGLLNVEESETYNKVNATIRDYQQQNVPNVIKGTMSWEDYVAGVDQINPESVLEYMQKYVELAKAVKTEK